MSSSKKQPNLDWKTPKPEAQIFEEIVEASGEVRGIAAWENFQKSQLKRAQKAYPKLDLSWEAMLKYEEKKVRDEFQAESKKPSIAVKEFFKKAFEWDPNGPQEEEGLTALLTSDRVENLPLGRFNGTHMYYLMPGTGTLPITGVPQGVTDFGFANAGGGAIAYPDGHPSEADQTISFRSKEDNRLRRVMPLGWLIRVTNENHHLWERTGHALVMDMDEGRQRHPWIVLAKDWPDSREHDEDERIYAEEVRFGDLNAHGILPGTQQRTPVGRFTFGLQQTNKNAPLLLSFGPDFEFGIQRYGGAKAGISKERGPPLAKVMEWYDDVKKGQMVCYDSDGAEYMRFDKSTKEYSYPNRFERQRAAGGYP